MRPFPTQRSQAHDFRRYPSNVKSNYKTTTKSLRISGMPATIRTERKSAALPPEAACSGVEADIIVKTTKIMNYVLTT